MLIAQLSDPHIALPGERPYGRVDTALSFERAVAAVAALSPPADLVLLSGDLAHHGLAEEYAHMKRLLAPLSQRVLAIPGNHDERESMRAAFLGDGYLPRSGFLNFAVACGPLLVIGLDTLVAGEDKGALSEEGLLWLEAALGAAADRPSLIVMHHPPFLTGIAPMDRIGLEGREGFHQIVRRNPQIEKILCGHVHRPIEARFAGTAAATAPSTAHQLFLDLDPQAPSSRFLLEPGGYQLHLWDEASGLRSHTALLGDYPGPYPFRSAL